MKSSIDLQDNGSFHLRPKIASKTFSLVYLCEQLSDRQAAPFLFQEERKKEKWRCRASIPVPLACKASALPSELHPRIGFMFTRQYNDRPSLDSFYYSFDLFNLLQIFQSTKTVLNTDKFEDNEFSF